jgi:hypothetical protein
MLLIAPEAPAGYGAASARELGEADVALLETPARVALIDYEYASLNDVAFDVANHWCEYAADYSAPGEEHVLRWERLPAPDAQLRFCWHYVAAARELACRRASPPPVEAEAEAAAACAGTRQGPGAEEEAALPPLWEQMAASAPPGATSDEEVESLAALLLRKAQAYIPLSHLKWGLWGLIQARTVLPWQCSFLAGTALLAAAAGGSWCVEWAGRSLVWNVLCLPAGGGVRRALPVRAVRIAAHPAISRHQTHVGT